MIKYHNQNRKEIIIATFTNQAVLSYNGITTNSNVATGEIVEVLSASKDALSSEYGPGETATYVINLVNSGSRPFTALTVTDDLGAYTLPGTEPDPGRRVYPLTYVDGSIRYYQNGVEQAAPAVTETITAKRAPYLTILKSVSPRQVPENGQITYTFDIQNLGNTAAEAGDNVQIMDTFMPVLSNIAVTYNGAVLPAANYTYNEETGEFATTVGAVTVPAADYAQDPATGVWTTTPGSAVLTVTGTIR